MVNWVGRYIRGIIAGCEGSGEDEVQERKQLGLLKSKGVSQSRTATL